MDQHPYYGAVLTVAIPVGLYYAVRAVNELFKVGDRITIRRARKQSEREQDAINREEAAFKAQAAELLSKPIDLGGWLT